MVRRDFVLYSGLPLLFLNDSVQLTLAFLDIVKIMPGYKHYLRNATQIKRALKCSYGGTKCERKTVGNSISCHFFFCRNMLTGTAYFYTARSWRYQWCFGRIVIKVPQLFYTVRCNIARTLSHASEQK